MGPNVRIGGSGECPGALFPCGNLRFLLWLLHFIVAWPPLASFYGCMSLLLKPTGRIVNGVGSIQDVADLLVKEARALLLHVAYI